MARVRILPSAERFLDASSQSVRIKIIEIAVELSHRPEIDGQAKFVFLGAPHVFRKFTDGAHWLIYDFVEGAGKVRVINAGSQEEPQRLYRPPP